MVVYKLAPWGSSPCQRSRLQCLHVPDCLGVNVPDCSVSIQFGWLPGEVLHVALPASSALVSEMPASTLHATAFSGVRLSFAALTVCSRTSTLAASG